MKEQRLCLSAVGRKPVERWSNREDKIINGVWRASVGRRWCGLDHRQVEGDRTKVALGRRRQWVKLQENVKDARPKFEGIPEWQIRSLCEGGGELWCGRDNSCLENPMGRGTWQATVNKVTWVQTWLRQRRTQWHTGTGQREAWRGLWRTGESACWEQKRIPERLWEPRPVGLSTPVLPTTWRAFSVQ